MRPHRSLHLGVFWSVLAACLPAGPVLAHSLMLSHGTVRIEHSVVWMTVEARSADVLHVAGVDLVEGSLVAESAWASAVDEFSILLMRSLAVHDESGKRLGARPASDSPVVVGDRADVPPQHIDKYGAAKPNSFAEGSLRDRRLSFRWGYVLDQPHGLLTFRLQITDDTAWHAWQMVLAVEEAGVENPLLLRLTSRGNAETLIVGHGAPLESSRMLRDEKPRMHLLSNEPTLLLNLEDGRLTVDLTIPLPVLETWVPLVRDHPDYLASDEQAIVETDIRKLLAGALHFEVDGLPQAASMEFVQFGPAGPAHQSDPVDLGFWAGRLRVRQSFSLPTPWHRAEVTCRCFNSAVLTIPAELRWPGEHRHHRLTTHEPTVSWSRSPSAITLDEAQ